MSTSKSIYVIEENIYKNITEESIYDTISGLSEVCQFSEKVSSVLHKYRKEKKVRFDNCSYFAFNKKEFKEFEVALKVLFMEMTSYAQIMNDIDELDSIIEALRIVTPLILKDHVYVIFISIF